MSEPVQAVGVCGFPRSGSSMTMRMLHAGGIPPVFGTSLASYELAGGLDPVAAMPSDRFAGRAVKLLDYGRWFEGLPSGVDWRFVWIDRDPVEQAKSNVKFSRILLGFDPGQDAVGRLSDSYLTDRPLLLDWYRERGEVLVSSFEAILADPSSEVARLAGFLPTLDAAAATGVVLDRPPDCAADMSVELSLAEHVA